MVNIEKLTPPNTMSIQYTELQNLTKCELKLSKEKNDLLEKTSTTLPKEKNNLLEKITLNTNVKTLKLLVAESFRSRMNISIPGSFAGFHIWEKFINKLCFNSELSKKYGIRPIAFFRENFICNYFRLDDFGNSSILFFLYDSDKIEANNLFQLSFSKYREDNRILYNISCCSNKNSKYLLNSLINFLWHSAILESELKGKFIEIPETGIGNYKILELEKRVFTDLFVPINIMNDIQLFLDIFNRTGKISKFLFAGMPGTGKTEALLILANELKKKKVTVFKVKINEVFPEIIILAEILSPSLILLDDIDLSIGNRIKGGYQPKLLQLFLDILDGTNKLPSDVGIIATTNAVELLDLAAQRPGRFDKIVSFDSLTKDNIAGIILKSLKYNFGLNGDTAYPLAFTSKEIIDIFYKEGVTGAYIYSSIKNLKEFLDMKGIIPNHKLFNTEIFIKRLDYELKIINKIRKINYLSEKLTHNTKTAGYRNTTEEEENIFAALDEPWKECEKIE